MEATEIKAASTHQGCDPVEPPQVLQLRPDRRLGHEWDDWDGNPVPNGGIYHEPPGLFFRLLGAWLLAWLLAVGVVLWLVGPRLATIWGPLPLLGWSALATATVLTGAWIGTLALALRSNWNGLPALLAEGGLLPRLMPLAERSGRWFGISRDRAGNAALRVFNGLASARARPGIRPDELLLLLPRCLDKEGMQGVMGVAARYGVPLFVAARGRYAREMIARVRPRAVVAIACERDLVSGVHDVAARLPVLGTTIGLPEGPCKNTTVDLGSLEERIRTFLGLAGASTG
jgi:hypothetical protein